MLINANLNFVIKLWSFYEFKDGLPLFSPQEQTQMIVLALSVSVL